MRKLLLIFALSMPAFGQVSAKAGETPNNTIILYGASIQGLNVSQFLSSVWAAPADGYFNWANAILGQPFKVINSCASGCSSTTGQTTSGLVAGSPPLYQAQVIAFHPGWVAVGDAIVNDLKGATTSATTIANLTTLYTAFYNAGIKMIMMTGNPFCNASSAICIDNSAYNPTDPRFVTINNWMKGWAQNHPGFYVADIAAAEIQATGFWGPAPAMTGDGTHLIALGGYSTGKALANALTAQIPNLLPAVAPVQIYNLDPTNLLTNGMMVGTGGTAGSGASGTVATSWTLTGNAGATCTGSKTARTDGMGEIQTIVINSGSGTGSYCELSQTFTGWTASVDTLQIQGEYMNGSSLTVQNPVSICYNASCAAGFHSGLWADVPQTMALTIPYMLVMSPLGQTVPGGATTATASVRVYGVSGTYNVGRVEVHKR